MKKEVKLYNVLFPLWILLAVPPYCLIVIFGNFLIDSLVLILAMLALKIESKKQWYKRYIWKIYIFGMLADIIGSAYMLWMALGWNIGGPWYDSPVITVPALLIAGALIFLANYFITFRKIEFPLRWKMALIFATVTAPYTFLTPSGWLYGW